MRILCGTILAALLAALSAHGAVDSLAGSPEGVGNISATGVLTNGALVISFDDRNLADWERAIPLFDKYDAHATFFFTGPCEGDAARVLKKLREHGHSIGLHGLKHQNADAAVAAKGAAAYWAEEIAPQLAGCRAAGIPITSFAYPNCCRTDETDALFRTNGFKHVRGGLKGVTPYDPKGEKQEGLKPVHTVDRAFFPAAELSLRFRLDTAIAGEAYHTDIEDILKCIRRCAELNEAFVLTSHGIHPDAKQIHMKTEWLERILATAKECGVAVLGFDELTTERLSSDGAGARVGAAIGNPVFDGWYADPQIRRYGDTWWIFPTGSGSFAKQPGFDAFSSKDMKTWTRHPGVLTTKDVAWAKGAMWAPDAHEVDGRYYIFFSANDAYPVGGKREDGEPQKEAKLQGYGGIGVAVAEKPEGPYRDLVGKPLVDRFWNRAQPIDQYVFEYRGEWYMVYGGWGRCNLVKLAKGFKSLVPFEDGAMWRDMTPKGYVEGPVMFERDGKWYFMYSAGSWTGDDYCVNYSVGKSPFGPFEFKGKVLGVQRPIATGAGHHSVARVPGTDEWYICYHRRPIPSEGRDHRVVCIDRMEFDPDGAIKPVVMTSSGDQGEK